MRLLALIIGLLLCQIEAKTQAKIQINPPGVNFDFNTFDKFNNGIERLNYTQIVIDFKDVQGLDGLGVYHGGWKLEFTPTAPTFDAFFGLVGPSINIIEFQITQTSGDGAITNVPIGYTQLNTGTTLLATRSWGGVDGNTYTSHASFVISYYCNQGYISGPIDLGNYINDTYLVELNFNLINIP